MIQKILFFLVFMAVGGLAVGWWHNYQRITMTRQMQIDQFMSQGARFTAADGQKLCERVRALEAASYGYRDQGKTPLTCDYAKTVKNETHDR